MYAPNNRVWIYIRQKLIELQGEIDESSIIVGDCPTPPLGLDSSWRQNISKDIVEFSITINQLDIIDSLRLLQPTAEYILFSSSHGTFTIHHYRCIPGNPKTVLYDNLEGWDGVGAGREVQERRAYVYRRLIHVDVWQKPTKYCKAVIL